MHNDSNASDSLVTFNSFELNLCAAAAQLAWQCEQAIFATQLAEEGCHQITVDLWRVADYEAIHRAAEAFNRW